MTILQAIPLVFLLADPTAGAGWEEGSKSEGITTYTRAKKDSNIREVKAVGMMDSAPAKVLKVVKDLANYKKIMPYTDESVVLATEEGGKVTFFYSVVNAPLVDKRDYVIRVVDESDWQDGKGFLKTTWSAAQHQSAPEKSGMVRVKINDGFWLIEPREGGAKSFVTYYAYLDSGGSLPNFIINKANNTSVPDVFKAVRREAAK